MSRSDDIFANAKHLATEYGTEALMLALAIQATDNVRDMMSDFVSDPNYVEQEGLPSKEKILQAASDYFNSTMPIMVSEGVLVPDDFQMTNGSPIEQVGAALVRTVYAYDPAMYQLKYQPR